MIKTALHIVIMVSFVLFGVGATATMLDYFFHADTIALMTRITAQVGSVIGIQVGVPSNPYNTLAQQLKEREDQLNSKETVLNARESTVLSQNAQNEERFLYYVFGIGGFLLALILANFYMDFHRRRNASSGSIASSQQPLVGGMPH